MLVKDVMTTKGVKRSPDNGVSQAAKLMFDHHVSGVPVIDSHPRDAKWRIGRHLLQAIFPAKQDETAAGDKAIRRSILVRLGENTGPEGMDLTATVTEGSDTPHAANMTTVDNSRRVSNSMTRNGEFQ